MRRTLIAGALVLASLTLPIHAQPPPPGQGGGGRGMGGQGGGRGMRAPIRKLSDTTYAVGDLRIDTAKRELTATGRINDVTVLEFVANTKSGFKAYESALTIDTDAITFNTALLLLGVDPNRSRVPTRHFDAIPPKGDPVDIFVEWAIGDTPHRIRVEELLFDTRTNKTLPEGPWVYTGSTFVDGRYLADIDGVLIGFVHSPAPVIENPRVGAVDAYGFVVRNPNIAMPPGRWVTIIIRALDRAGGG